ncbi:MAG: hypothetical protein ABIP06_10055 [Pyrinomonadaceae bacterium]
MTDLQLKQYLLGNPDAQTDEEIGVRILADESFEETLLIAENDLIEDFLDKNLSSEDEKLFFDNFLICEDRQKQVSEINLFRQFSKKHFQTEHSAAQANKTSESIFEKIKKIFDFKPGFAVPVLAVLIVLCAGIYFLYQPEKLSPLENEYAGLNRKDFADIKQLSEFSNVSLIAGTFRDSGAVNKLKAENLSDRIFLRLALPFNLPENELLKAEIVRDQQTVFRQPETRIYKNQNGQEIRLLLPKEVLTKGQFQIKLENLKTGNSTVTYNFAVE